MARFPRHAIPAAASAAVAAAALGIGGVINPAHRTPGPRPVTAPTHSGARGYASQSRSMKVIHRAYVRWGTEDARNQMGAACEAHDVQGWAQILGTPPTIDAVSRAVAATADPAFRKGAYLGCRDALLG
jgi:hypothetical protein